MKDVNHDDSTEILTLWLPKFDPRTLYQLIIPEINWATHAGLIDLIDE